MLKKFIFLMALFPSLLFGGEIYGTIKIGKRPIGEGIKVEIVCGEKTYTKKTDKHGAYSIYVQNKGRGMLIVHYPEESDHAPSIFLLPPSPSRVCLSFWCMFFLRRQFRL